MIARNRVGISLNGTAIPNVGRRHRRRRSIAVRTTIGPGNIVTNQADGVTIGPEATSTATRSPRTRSTGTAASASTSCPAGVNPNGFYPANGPNQAAQFPIDRDGLAARASPAAPAPAAPSRSSSPTAAPTRSARADVRRLRRRGRDRHVHASPSASSPGDFVTATATDANGNTSEFSLNRAVTASGRRRRRHAARPRHVHARPPTDSLGHRRPSAARGPCPTPFADYDVAGGVGTYRRARRRQQRAALLSSLAAARRRHDRADRDRQARAPAATTGSTRRAPGRRRTSTAPACAWPPTGAVFCGQPRRRRTPRPPIGHRGHRDRAHPHRRARADLGAHAGDGREPDHDPHQGLGRRRARAQAWNLTADELRGGSRRPPARSALRTYVGGALTNAPIRSSFDELRARSRRPTTAVAPAAPQNLVATPGSNRVALTWTPEQPSADIVGYHVYRSTTTPVPTTGTPLSGSAPVTDAALRRHDRRQRHDLPLRRRRRRRYGAAARAPRTRPSRRRTPPPAAACSSTARAST